MSMDEVIFPSFLLEGLVDLSQFEPSEEFPSFPQAEPEFLPPPSPLPCSPSVSSPGKQDYETIPLSCTSEDHSMDQEPWEKDLDNLLSDVNQEVPIEPRLKEELIGMAVSSFNKQVKQLRLDPKTVEYLKLERKRVKNRLSAHRSRSRKEAQVTDLENRVEALLKENSSQKLMIQQLMERLERAEKLRSR